MRGRRGRFGEPGWEPRLFRAIAEARASTEPREASPRDRRDALGLVGVLAVLLATILLSIPSGKPAYIVGYVVAIVYALRGPSRNHRPWSELGVKGGFFSDLKKTWVYVALVAVVFQVLPPTMGAAHLLGDYAALKNHILGRLAVDFGTAAGWATLGGLLLTFLVLTLMEELVFRVTVQERLTWFFGVPAGVILGTAVFAFAHLGSGIHGSVPVILLDIAGVALDGLFLGIIYARTHNLVLNWATHFACDAVGLFALLLIL